MGSAQMGGLGFSVRTAQAPNMAMQAATIPASTTTTTQLDIGELMNLMITMMIVVMMMKMMSGMMAGVSS